MGLDMYAHTVRKASKVGPVPNHIPEEDYLNPDLHYWRKHPNLHGWMEALYREKGGTDETFNCVYVELTSEDLDRLEAAIKSGELPETSGFFFGQTVGDETEDDLQFVADAREAIAEGERVFYSSWW